jgi:dTDP-4-dehydrorhamnose reductase
MTILVVGSEGQVAQSLAEAGRRRGLDLKARGRPVLDLTRRASICEALDGAAPKIVINAAAYTAVDQAETDEAAAFALNAEGPGMLAEETAARGLPLIHLSTDYVFDGEAQGPIPPDAATAPLGVYGRSKLAGEEAVSAGNPEHLIFRTAWVYGPFGKNFLRTMLRLAKDRDTLNVVADQRGCPTTSTLIAESLLSVAESLKEGSAPWGTYHLTASGETSWAGFAEAIFEESRTQGGPSATVNPIPSADYPTPAKRPSYSVLDCTETQKRFGLALPDWRREVAGIVGRVLAEADA